MNKVLALNKITEFFDCKFICNGFSVKKTNGEMFFLADAKIIDLKSNDSSLTIEGIIGADNFRLCFNKLCSNIATAVLELSLSDKNDKVAEIESLNFTLPVIDYETIMLHDFLDSAVSKIDNINDSCESKYFTGFYNKEDLGITIVSKVPAKFYARHKILKNRSNLNFSFNTALPISYEGNIASEMAIICWDMSGKDALMNTAEIFNTKQDNWQSPIGWSSWDYYYTSVNEEAVRENTDFIANDPVLSKKIEYIAIDDGWQQREGSWWPTYSFKNGLEKIVEYIEKKGFKAGIWTAPTRLQGLCSTIMRRNDFLARNEIGDPVWDGDMYILDPTHPSGEAFLRETFTYLRKAGFKFYKLDFLSNLLTVKYFYDKNAGCFDALRRLIAIVRECVGSESHIMGCAYPYGTGAGYVDSRRTGLDIHNNWPHIEKCTQIFLPQFASHRKLYQNDIDYLLVRGTETSLEKETSVFNPTKNFNSLNPVEGFTWRGGEEFSYIEAKTWCTVTLLSGSSIFLGDRLSMLNEKGLDLVKRTVLNADFESAKPQKLSEIPLPSVWFAEQSKRIYIINWASEDKKITIDISNFNIAMGQTYQEIFSEEIFNFTNNIMTFDLKTHESIALKLI